MTVGLHDQALKGESTRRDDHCVQHNRALKGETDPALLEKIKGGSHSKVFGVREVKWAPHPLT